MSNREFTATRTMLANAFATAGAELLECMGTAAALAAIPNTEPPQYAVAGTLQMIAKVLPSVSAAEKPTGDLTDERAIYDLAAEHEANRDGLYGPVTFDATGLVDFARHIERAAIAAHLERQAQQAESPVDQGHVLRTLRRLLDGSQPTDIEGSVMVIDNALKTGVSWSYDVAPPQGFIDYVKANYTGDVYFHDPEWHAMRLWNAAMKNVGARLAAPASQEGAHAALDEAREEAAKLAIKFTAVPRDCLGPATSHMKAMATVGEKIAAAIRALKTPACAERSGDHG